MEEKVTITAREYKHLLNADKKLSALEINGVDNWCGYDDAMQDFYKEEDEN